MESKILFSSSLIITGGFVIGVAKDYESRIFNNKPTQDQINVAQLLLIWGVILIALAFLPLTKAKIGPKLLIALNSLLEIITFIIACYVLNYSKKNNNETGSMAVLISWGLIFAVIGIIGLCLKIRK